MNRLNVVRTGNVLGIISAVFFLACMAWGFLFSDLVLQELHLNLLRLVYPGFTMSFVGAVIGIVEAFVYGWLFGALFAWLCRVACVSEDK